MAHNAERRHAGWRVIAPRQLRWSVVDVCAWMLAITTASFLRVDFNLSDLSAGGQVLILPVVAAAHMSSALLFGLYAGRWHHGSFDEVAALVRTTALATTVVLVVDFMASHPRMVPLTAVVGGGILALVLMAGTRYATRLVLERRKRPTGEHLTRVLVFGSGEGATRLVTSMLRDSESPYLPVALLDDAPHRQRLEISGIPVVGTRADIVDVAKEHRADALVIAIPSADRTLVSELSALAREANIAVKVLPSTRELLGGLGVGDIRDVTPGDLLGRRGIETSVESIAEYVTGARVMVVGAGGSIGSELCRQIYRFAPGALTMLDRDESALHAVQLSLTGKALLNDESVILADIRERDALEAAMQQARPDVVFHAAALKHLPLLERHPAEGFRTNVVATQTLLELCTASGVDTFVNISTDKAADPVSVLGYSKRIAERLTSGAAAASGRRYVSVRFGNVLGSRGSALESFQSQIDVGGPVTVTDPEVTRYFMTVSEAVQLVVQAGAIGRPGEVLVLDMGEPVMIEEVVRQLAAIKHRDVEIVYTGLRPGEKLHEVLWGEEELDQRPSHPLISQVAVPSLDPSAVDSIDLAGPAEVVVAQMKTLCGSGLGTATT
ncbi:MAG: nucleoside-diphosphate sugar epimerase/dehydratase [Acidimicrobiia bacterium]